MREQKSGSPAADDFDRRSWTTGSELTHTPAGIARWGRFWAEPLNRLVVDPDGRSERIRGTREL